MFVTQEKKLVHLWYSRCLEFFFALVPTQQKTFNAGSKLSVDTTVNKRDEERITLSKKENNMINNCKCLCYL